MKSWWLYLILGWSLIITSCSTPDDPNSTNPITEDGNSKINSEFTVKSVIMQEATDTEGNIERFFVRADNGQRHGKYFLMRPDSSLIEEANYNNGLLNGLRIFYYEHQDTQIVQTHLNGKFHGPYRSFYEEGGIKVEGEYQEDKMEGFWFKYYPTGELMEKVTFTDNAENGPFEEYYKNGQIKVEGFYLDGDNEDGELKFYDDQGTLIKTMDCNRGMCKTTWKLEDNTL